MKTRRVVMLGLLAAAFFIPYSRAAAVSWGWQDAFGHCVSSCDPNVYACPCVYPIKQ